MFWGDGCCVDQGSIGSVYGLYGLYGFLTGAMRSLVLADVVG